MKPIITFLIAAVSLGCYAAEPAATNSNWLKAAFAEDKKQNFNSGEFNIDAFGVLSRPDLTGAPRWGAGLGVNYFFTRGFGVGARGTSYNVVESFVDEVDARIILRVPLLWDQVAPYGFVSGIYSFEGDCAGAGAGGGIEFRFTKRLAAFAETGIRVWANCDDSVSRVNECGVKTSSSPDGHAADWQTVAGIRLIF